MSLCRIYATSSVGDNLVLIADLMQIPSTKVASRVWYLVPQPRQPILCRLMWDDQFWFGELDQESHLLLWHIDEVDDSLTDLLTTPIYAPMSFYVYNGSSIDTERRSFTIKAINE